jgi:hypothetical protein
VTADTVASVLARWHNPKASSPLNRLYLPNFPNLDVIFALGHFSHDIVPHIFHPVLISCVVKC